MKGFTLLVLIIIGLGEVTFAEDVTACFDDLKSIIRSQVHDAVEIAYRTYVWSSDSRNRFSNTVADEVVSDAKFKEILGQGGDTSRMSIFVVYETCAALKHNPTNAMAVKNVCSVSRSSLQNTLPNAIAHRCNASAGCCAEVVENTNSE